jgi:hypothetical protein
MSYTRDFQLDNYVVKQVISCLNNYSFPHIVPKNTVLRIKPLAYSISECVVVCGEVFGIILKGTMATIIKQDDETWFIPNKLPEIFDLAHLRELERLCHIANEYVEKNGTPRYFEGIRPKILCGYTLK